MPSLAIVPAAGRAERFGRQKLVELVGGEPILNRTLRCLIDGGVDRVVVVSSPAGGLDGVPLLADARVRTTVNADPSRGMFSSIQIGVLQASESDPILVLPGDMPFVQPATVAAVLRAARGQTSAVVPRLDGRRGHPVALPGALGREILKADARSNLSDLLGQLGVVRLYLDVTDPGILRDVDVAGDLDQ
ncbi:MAG: NTP transferase domain-containing protein [Vicinamibacterales bacterium]